MQGEGEGLLGFLEGDSWEDFWGLCSSAMVGGGCWGLGGEGKGDAAGVMWRGGGGGWELQCGGGGYRGEG